MTMWSWSSERRVERNNGAKKYRVISAGGLTTSSTHTHGVATAGEAHRVDPAVGLLQIEPRPEGGLTFGR